MTQTDIEDILVWPDGTWCYRYGLREMTHMSDDYRTLAFGSAEHQALAES